MTPLILLLTTTLILHSGDQITVEGPVTEENGVVRFRANGLLYSVPASEIASRGGAVPATEPRSREVRRLTVTAEERDRRLRELEQNRAGVPAPPEQRTITPPPPQKDTKPEERYWRDRAREHAEAVRRAQEDLALLESRIEELRYEIRAFVNQGYEPAQFTYQTTRLVRSEELLPAARLEVTRAERAQAQFREDARRDGIMPGWLR